MTALVQLETELHLDTEADGLQALFHPWNGKGESGSQLGGGGATFVFGVEAEGQVIVVEDGDTLGHIP